MDSAPSASSESLTLPILLASGDSLSITTTRQEKFEAYPASIATDGGSVPGLMLTCSGGYSRTSTARLHASTSVSPSWFPATASESEGLDASQYDSGESYYQEHDMAENEAVLRVKGTANVSSLASAISHAVYDGKTVTLRAIGASAISQAIKAVAVARGYVAPRGIDLMLVPGFTNVEMPDGTVTAITLRVVSSVG